MTQNPFTERMDAIARLRSDRLLVDAQINDEITRAWRLMEPKNLKSFAATLGMPQADVKAVLASRGINVDVVP